MIKFTDSLETLDANRQWRNAKDEVPERYVFNKNIDIQQCCDLKKRSSTISNNMILLWY